MDMEIIENKLKDLRNSFTMECDDFNDKAKDILGFILQNGELDYYEVPDTFALNFRNQNIELNDKDIKNIDNFLNMLHEAMPEGFDIIWNKQTCESPYFVMRPEFGAGSDCVNLYVYSKSKKDETNV